jgi:thiamine pyrophosphate-dependent acetolactate synthase large subunit-like protein
MALGAFATIGAKAPKNLSVIVIDNEHYSETGMQPTHTHRGVSLAAVAKACNFPRSETVYTEQELASEIPGLFTGSDLVFCAVKVNTQRYPMSIRMRDGAHIKNRFRENLLGQKAFD